MHFVSEDNFHFYVGKNNYQNEEVSFTLAAPTDWWFHAKDIAGSHVNRKNRFCRSFNL